jgi:hypothetical protein
LVLTQEGVVKTQELKHREGECQEAISISVLGGGSAVRAVLLSLRADQILASDLADSIDAVHVFI